ncbi:hypothetical protein [Streptomyces sp. NPDC055105]|uniref:hypothetical protein n=1 Tax=Streptomyces sp. NPDC055105 TaxID=3365719 RepID=UPI0037D46DE5
MQCADKSQSAPPPDAKPGRPTALKIPSPWSGDEYDPIPRSYRAWFWLYKTTRQLRHRINLHDYRYVPALHCGQCSWCHKTK